MVIQHIRTKYGDTAYHSCQDTEVSCHGLQKSGSHQWGLNSGVVKYNVHGSTLQCCVVLVHYSHQWGLNSAVE